jgi:hypothetical protein
MGTTAEEIRSWVQAAKADPDCSYLIVATDTFDWEDYPVQVRRTEDINERVAQLNGPNLQKVMEIYKLDFDLEEQLREHRAWHL